MRRFQIAGTLAPAPNGAARPCTQAGRAYAAVRLLAVAELEGTRGSHTVHSRARLGRHGRIAAADISFASSWLPRSRAC